MLNMQTDLNMKVGGSMGVLTYAEHVKAPGHKMRGTMAGLTFAEQVKGFGHECGRNYVSVNLC